jgi:hypothetical protein
MIASMFSRVYYWLQNAIRFLWENIRSWCAIFVCLQRESELGVTQELALQSRALHKSDISGASYVTCPGTYPSSRIPSSHWILSCSRPLLFESHLIVLPFTLPEALHLSNVTSLRSLMLDTITFLIVVSDSIISVASDTLALIWRSHIDLSLVSPFPSTTTVNSMPSSYRDRQAFSAHGYYCVVHRHEFISLPFQRISSGTSPEYVLVDQPCFFNFFNCFLSLPPVCKTNFEGELPPT